MPRSSPRARSSTIRPNTRFANVSTRSTTGWTRAGSPASAARSGRLLGRRRADAPPRGLYIYGEVGRGKTMLMDLFFAVRGASEEAPRPLSRVHGGGSRAHPCRPLGERWAERRPDRDRRRGTRRRAQPPLPRRVHGHRHRRRNDPVAALRRASSSAASLSSPPRTAPRRRFIAMGSTGPSSCPSSRFCDARPRSSSWLRGPTTGSKSSAARPSMSPRSAGRRRRPRRRLAPAHRNGARRARGAAGNGAPHCGAARPRRGSPASPSPISARRRSAPPTF